ncbi:MAG: acyl carrier protein [Reyranellaceae bacterium]
MADIAAEFRDILVLHLGAEEGLLTDKARLAEDLGADSLDLVEIVMSCEERFDIEIPNRSAVEFTTVGEAVRFLTAQLAAAAAADPVHRSGRLLSALR